MGRVTYKGNALKPKMKHPVRYAHTEIRTLVVVICDPIRYQIEHGAAENVLTSQIESIFI